MNLRNQPYVYLWILLWFIFYMQPYVLHLSTRSTICVFIDTNLVYLQHAAVCPTWIYEIDHMCIYGYKLDLSSKCSRMSYMNLRNRPYVYLWILIWFIFNMLPYVLNKSTKSTICVFMDTNLVYLLHATVWPTWIYEIDHMCIYGYKFGLSSTCSRMSYMIYSLLWSPCIFEHVTSVFMSCKGLHSNNCCFK